MDPPLKIIPEIQEWTAQDGHLALPHNLRLVVSPKDEMALASAIQVMRTEIQRRTRTLVDAAVSEALQPGDIFCSIASDAHVNPEGYSLTIGEHIDVCASTPTGIFYGLQTLCELITQTDRRFPKGLIRDWPHYPHRGLMLDAGRRYWQMPYLHELMQNMARFKLNELHLHFTDWNAFRLQSDQHPSLAAKQSYGKADIAQLQAWADQYHISLVPEIDLPAHATVINQYNPLLAMPCRSMSHGRWQGSEDGNWTINYTDPYARQWMKDLIGEFIPLFKGACFHLGTDELPDGNAPAQCSELVRYAHSKGYAYAGDVFVEWINDMNAFVRSFGKQLQLWSWWERSPHSISPDKDIIVNVWVGAGKSGFFLDAGYPVIHTAEDILYLTPNLGLFPNTNFLYNDWVLSDHPNSIGYKLCVWADKAEEETDAFFENYLRLPRAVFAARTWKKSIPQLPLDTFMELITTQK